MNNIKLSNIDQYDNVCIVINELSNQMDDHIFHLFIRSLYDSNIKDFLTFVVAYFAEESIFSNCFGGYSSDEIVLIKKQLKDNEENINIIVEKLSVGFNISNSALSFGLDGGLASQRFNNISRKISNKRKTTPRVKTNTIKPFNIGENINVRGGVSKFETRLISTFVEYCVKYLKIENTKIKIQYRVIEKGSGGFMKNSKDKINWEIVLSSKVSTERNLNIIAHELTHVKQSVYKQLVINGFGMVWTIEDELLSISTKQYNELLVRLKSKKTDVQNLAFDEYKSLPWETEAYYNGDLISKTFMGSNEFKELVETSTDPTQKFMLENL